MTAFTVTELSVSSAFTFSRAESYTVACWHLANLLPENLDAITEFRYDAVNERRHYKTNDGAEEERLLDVLVRRLKKDDIVLRPGVLLTSM